MTVDVYGRWLPSGNRALIDQLDGEQPAEAESGSKSVANSGSDENEASEVPASSIPCPPPSNLYIVNDLLASS